MSWNKTVRTALLTIVGVILLLVAAAYVMVHTSAFNRFVLERVVEEAKDATGSRVEIRSLQIHWSKLSVDVNGLVIQGKGGNAQPPFLRVDHAAVGLKIISILRRKVDLSELVLDRPILDVRINAQGETNAPKPAPGNPSSNAVSRIFDLAIGHFLINSGQVLYSDINVPVSVDLHDLRADASYSLLAGVYTGSLSYDRGVVRVESLNPIEHDTRMNFIASRTEFDARPLYVSVGATRFTTLVKLTNYQRPNVQVTYAGTVSTPELARILKTPELPTGQVAMSGTVRYQYAPGQSFFDETHADGQFSSARLGIRIQRAATEAQAVKGSFSIDSGNLHVSSLQANLLQGRLTAKGDILDLAGSTSTRVTASLNGIPLEAVNQALPPGTYDRLPFTGKADIDAQAAWPRRFADAVAHFRIAIAAPQKPPNAHSIPLNGLVDVRYDGRRDVLDFGQSQLQTGSTRISLTGRVSKQSSLMVRANTMDLHEVFALVSEIRATMSSAASNAVSTPLQISGSAAFSGEVSGSVKDPKIQGQLSASNMEVEGSRWRSMHANLQLASSRIALQDGNLQSASQGQLEFSGSAGLSHWSLTPASPISLQTIANNLSVAALEHLAGQHYPVEGTFAANISVHGTKQNPSGQGFIQITKALAWNQPINNLSVKIQTNGTRIQSTAQLQIPAGKIHADVTFSPTTGQYDATLNTSGLKVANLQIVQARNMGITGLLNVSVHGQSSLSNPQLSADLQVSQFQFRGQAISRAEAAVNLSGQRASFTLHSAIAEGEVEAKGDLDLVGNYNSSVTLDVHSVPLGTVLASYVSGAPPNLHGQAEVHATLNGPLKEPALIEAEVKIPSFNLAYEAANIALVNPLRLEYRQGTITLQKTELKGTGTDLTLQGMMPLRKRTGNFNIDANGGLDLSLLQAFTRNIKSSGRILVQVSGHGNFSNPTVQGDFKIQNAYLSSDAIPVGVEGLNGQINLSGRRLEIAQLTGTAGGGSVSLQGYMAYGARPSFNVALKGNSVRLRYPEGLRSVFTSELQLAGTPDDSRLTGHVVIDRLSFTQQFDLANFLAQFSSGASTPSSSAIEQNMRLSVAVGTSQQLNLVSSRVSFQGEANLNVTGTLANPVVLGRMTLNGGEVFFMGKRFDIQSGGSIQFANPVRTEPVLNLYLKTTVQQYDITMNFVGPVDRLRTSYTSDPALPTADIISLLTSGQTAEQAATSNTPAMTSAESVVASGVAGQLSSRIERLAGITQLTIDPLAASNTAHPASQVSIQQRVSGNILLTFSTDVTSTQATSVELQYRLSKQTSVSVLRDQNGGYAVDFRIHKTF
jgi:translocation and assembly module TamB